MLTVVACEQAPGEDGRNIWRAKLADERETEEFGKRGDRGGALGLAGSLFSSYDRGVERTLIIFDCY